MVGTRVTIHNGKNAMMNGCVRDKVSVRPYITYFFIMLRVVDLELFEFIIPLLTKNSILLGESRQDFLVFFAMHKTRFPLVNVAKYVRKEGIKIWTNF